MIAGGIRSKGYDIGTGPSTGRSRRFVAAWAGLFLLFFNVVAGGALATQAPPSLSSGDHMVVCTAGGMAVIDRNGTPVAPEHAGLNGFCGYCLPLMHGAALGAAAQPLPLPFAAPVPVSLYSTGEAAIIASQSRLAQARAPPLV